jgi:hypothetical protein
MAALGATGLRKWLAFGEGVAIEIDGDALNILASRVRPNGVSVIAAHRIERIHERQAADWGQDYAAFLNQHRLQRQSALVLLPRRDLIVRTVNLPGVPDKDLAGAMQFQLDGLHPYAEQEAHAAWARLGQSSTVVTAIARWDRIQHWSVLLAEAGIALSGFTFSAACLWFALRFLRLPPAEGFLALHTRDGATEAYGESPAQPLFSAVLDATDQRTVSLAIGQLRLPPDTEVQPLARLLPPPLTAPEGFDLDPHALLYAASLAAACPHLALNANLLPPERRVSRSPLQYVPTAALAGLLLIAVGILAAQQPYQDAQYLNLVNAEIAKAERRAARARQLDNAIATARHRIGMLDEFRRRSIADADALRELTSLLAPPAWAQSVHLTRTQATVSGEAQTAAPLLKAIDASPLFRNSEFIQAMGRTGGGGETFTIRAQREAGPPSPADAPKPQAPQPSPEAPQEAAP